MSQEPFLRKRPVALDVEPVAAMQQSELLRGHELNRGGYKPEGEYGPTMFAFIAGKHGRQTVRAVVFNWFMEMLGSMFIGMSVALGAWFAYTSNKVINMIIIAVLSLASWLVSTRLPADYTLRRHCSGAITTSYLFSGDIGIPGWFYYLLAQTIGALFGGLTVMGLLKYMTAQTGIVVQSTVPIPITTNTSFTTVFCLEVFGSAIIALVQLTVEYLNTEGDSHTKGASDETIKKLQKNYRKATSVTALTIVWLVLIGYHFDVFTYNNVGYMGGLFAGINPHQGPGIPDTVRDISNLANLNNALLYPNSVFIGRTAAWALYFFGPILGGIIAGILFRFLFWLGAKGPNTDSYRKKMFPNPYLREGAAGVISGAGNAAAAATTALAGSELGNDDYNDPETPYQRMSSQPKTPLPTGLHRMK